MEASARLPAEPTTPRLAREFVHSCVEDLDSSDAAETIALLTTEIVTNAVLHARTEMQVQVERGADWVWVGVRDGSRTSPTQRRYSRDAATGRGLVLLELMAREWGVDVDSSGKTVWFKVSLTEADAAAPDLDFFLSFDADLGAER